METKNVLVCVTQQKTCERLIKEAHQLTSGIPESVYIINVVRHDVHFLDSPKESEALEYLFGISKSINANLTVLKSDHIAGAIAEYATDHHIDTILLGKSPTETKSNRFVRELRNLLKKDVEIIVM